MPSIFIPDHTLLKPIGKGSYGTVWLARNIMGVCRAVKIVYRKSFVDDRPFKRELAGIRNFEPISRSHEGFVDILHVGIKEDQSCFYYVMELGDDQNVGQDFDPKTYSPKTLSKEISLRGRLSLPECLQLGIALSDALGELHKHGLTHRDVKPSNIIFVNGVPKLADIGLVAGLDETRSFVGTQGYIPPEGPGTPQADIYSLGKVLYEASTGKDRQDFPELPTALETLGDQEELLELNEVLLQACKNDISKRYQSAWDMHTDLLIISKGKSVKRLKVLERRLANAKRAAGISILFLLLLSAIGYPIYREHRAANAARQQQVGENVAYGNQAVESGDLLRALPFFAEALRLDQGNLSEESAHRLRYGSALAQCPKLTQMWALGADIRDGQFSPDGRMVLISELTNLVQIFDAETGTQHLRTFGQGGWIGSSAFSPDGQLVVTANGQGTACVWNTADLSQVCQLPHLGRVLSARFSPDSRRLVTGCSDGHARVWDARTQASRPELDIKGHTGTVTFAAFSYDGNYIVTTSRDKTAFIWNSKDGRKFKGPFKHQKWVNYASFSPDDTKIVTACADHKARVWDRVTGERVLIDLSHNDAVQSAEFSPDGRLIVTASLDGTARIWRADNGEPLHANLVLRHSAGVTHASFSPDGSRIITTCIDGTARIWDLAGSLLPPVPVHESFCADGSRFLTITNGILEVFDALSGNEVSREITSGMGLASVNLNENGRYAFGVSSKETNREIRVWNTSTGKAILPGLVVDGLFTDASVSGDGTELVVFGGKMAECWNLLTRTVLWPFVTNTEPIDYAFFNPGGSLLAIESTNSLRVLNATNSENVFAPLTLSRPLSYAAFSSDGALLVTCCSDNQINKCYAQIWESATGRPRVRNFGTGMGCFSLRLVLTANMLLPLGRTTTLSSGRLPPASDLVARFDTETRCKQRRSVRMAIGL